MSELKKQTEKFESKYFVKDSKGETKATIDIRVNDNAAYVIPNLLLAINGFGDRVAPDKLAEILHEEISKFNAAPVPKNKK